VAPAPYEIRVRGKLGEGVANSFSGFEAEVEPAETILRGAVASQSDLRALLEKLESLGLELIEVRRVDRSEDTGRRRS
jgi:hypothetical protein